MSEQQGTLQWFDRSGVAVAGKVQHGIARKDLEDRGPRGLLVTKMTGAGEGGSDEVVSLPGGLLQAGAAGVIGSLWSVPDASTALLMERFYQYWRTDRREPAEALRRAQQAVREAHPHPYNWAALAYVGA